MEVCSPESGATESGSRDPCVSDPGILERLEGR